MALLWFQSQPRPWSRGGAAADSSATAAVSGTGLRSGSGARWRMQ